MKLQKLIRTAGLVALMAAAGIGLSGCFDLDQKVSVGRDGSGEYHVAISAEGFVGAALKDQKIVDTDHNHADMTTTNVNGRVTRTATVAFGALSDLTLSNETMSVAVKSRDLFGLGPSHVAFRCVFLVDKEKNEQTASANGIGEEIAQAVLGNHHYSFSVTVPGDVEHVSPISIGNQLYQPQVTGDFYHGHTVTWRLPLYALVDTKALTFEVDFAALGMFKDVKTKLSEG
jgi:hypothetical protein